MSFVTTARGGATGEGSATPPDPCPHSGAATRAATAAVADHRAQSIIPTSVEVRRLFPSTERESHVHIAAWSRLIIAPKGRVDNHRPHVRPIEHVVEPNERVQTQGADPAIPAHPHVRRPPRAGGGVEGVVHEEPRRSEERRVGKECRSRWS